MPAVVQIAINRAGAVFGVAAVGWVVLGGWLAYATLVDLKNALVVRATPPEVLQDLIVRNAEDLLGRRAMFRVLLFTDEFRWRLNSHDALNDGAAEPHFTPEMKTVLNSAKEIICVGASSEELPLGASRTEGRVREERRAGRRAETIALWVRQALSTPVPVRKLNIGYHAPTRGDGDTSDQRRVVIILVLDHDEGTNLDQALRSAMARESTRAPIFDTLLTKYSLASGPVFTWMP
jgi:hypothetical protein